MQMWDFFRPAKIDFSHAKEDVLAGTICMVVAIPLCLALAVASGVDPVLGIYSGILGGFLVALFGGTELGVAGPAAAMTVLLFSVVAKFGLEGLLLAGFLAGLIQIAMGLTGIGRVVKFIPHTVIIGFTTGIGVLILIGQLGNVTGLNTKAEGVVSQLALFSAHLPELDLITLALGVFTLGLIYLIPRFSKKIPASFVALILSSLLAFFLALNVKTIGSVPSTLPFFQMISFSPHLLQDIIPSAFAISLLASIESLLSAVAADGMTGLKHNSSKELVGQGIANVVLPFFGGIPVTGVIVRTATNIKNGGKTRLSAIVHSVLLLVVLLVLAPFAQSIPMAVLAGILIFTAFHLIALEELKAFWEDSKSDFGVAIVTVASTVFLDLTMAILIGFTLAGLVFMKKMSENVDVELVPPSLPENSTSTLPADIAGVARTYKVSGPLFFGSAYQLEQIADETPEKKTPALVLDLRDVHYLDASGMAILHGLVKKHHAKGDVYLAVKDFEVKKKILLSSMMNPAELAIIVRTVEEGLSRAKQKYGKPPSSA
jgi:SulP family sulfate permease